MSEAETWQENLEAMIEAIDAKGHSFSPWEMEFLADMAGKKYENLSPKQKAIVIKLWEKS